jgi:ATP adenylyltransferase
MAHGVCLLPCTMHEQLWAPWRLEYIKGQDEGPRPERKLVMPEGADPQCFICRAAADSADRENLVVHRGELTITVLNRYPYNNGHLLVAPAAHLGRLDQLSADQHADCMHCVTMWVGLLEKLINADGFNLGLNLGRVAGAGLPGHLHWHIVPRWNGDTNFMPVLAGIRVIPQSLDALWQVLTDAVARDDET